MSLSPRSGVPPPTSPLASWTSELSLPGAAFLGFACVSAVWSSDVDAAGNRIAFFLLPFAALVAVVARSPRVIDYPWAIRIR